ncbi:hypothetical protein BKA69DRAFT_5919 [Paraphysoderma sedebokerense]|nr:hypothetical protein BKA69DRAFT_5919 [Paraphysoderma sedebokerense]
MSSKGAKRLQKDILPDEPAKDRSKSEKYTSLQIENENMTKAHEKFDQDKQDIVDYLHIELSNKDKAIANADEKIHQLETKIIGLHQSHSEETENLKRQHQYEIANLTSRINLLQQEITEILEFKGKKGELEKQLKDLNSLLVEKDKEYKCDIQHLERKYIQDKNFLKKDMVQKVTDAVGTFKKMADQQMEDTTKRVIRENLTISSQLRNLSTKTLELITENELLKKKNRELSINNSLLQDEQKVMAKRYKIKHLSKKQMIAASMEE